MSVINRVSVFRNWAGRMTHQVDHIDRSIVRLLLEDGRMSSAEIARRLGDITERAVRYRVGRLTREGVIRVSALVNPKAIGFPVTADIFIEVEAGHAMEVAQRLTEFDCVGYVGCSTGDREVSIQVYARDNEELYRFAAEAVGNVPGVRKTSTHLVPLVLKYVYQWQIPDSVCKGEKDEFHKSV
jgi:Lrp/AsnC family transcriptional regulator for asnA, asnC and gidA